MEQQSIADQFRQVVKDGIDYFNSTVTLLQARAAAFALSGVTFVVMMALAALLMLAGFTIFNIALGVWLARTLNSPTASLLILGGFYVLLAIGLGGFALRWLSRLRS